MRLSVAGMAHNAGLLATVVSAFLMLACGLIAFKKAWAASAQPAVVVA
jgi:hypothetical protein